MKRYILILTLGMSVATSASAECYADYKAKRDAPLRLHYGVIQVPDDICGQRGAVSNYIQGKLRQDAWELLNVISVFDREQLNDKKQNAGDFYLRY